MELFQELGSVKWQQWQVLDNYFFARPLANFDPDWSLSTLDGDFASRRVRTYSCMEIQTEEHPLDRNSHGWTVWNSYPYRVFAQHDPTISMLIFHVFRKFAPNITQSFNLMQVAFAFWVGTQSEALEKLEAHK